MGHQKADDPARNLTNVWLGADIIRNTARARYVSWAVWVALFALCGVLFWLVLPTLALLLLGVAYVSRIVVRRSLILGVIYVVGITGVAWLLLPDVTFWLYPLPWWAAWLPALITSILVTRSLMRHVEANRPVRYWWRSLDAAARAPRPTRTPEKWQMRNSEWLTPERFAAMTGDSNRLDIDAMRRELLDLTDLDMQSLLTKEFTVARYEPVTMPVEAEQWLPGDHAAAAAFRAWLSKWEVEHRIREFPAGSPPMVLLLDGDGRVTEGVHAGGWLLLPLLRNGTRDRDAVPKVLRDKDFRREFRAVVDAL